MSKKTLILIVCATITLMIAQMVGSGSAFIERFYYRGFFQVLRVAYDMTIGWLPIPMMYFFILAIAYVIYRLVRGIRRQSGLKSKTKFIVFSIVQFLSVVIIYFYWAWGFNYNRVSIEDALGIPVVEIDSIQLRALIEDTETLMIEIRHKINLDKITSKMESQGLRYENVCREGIEETLASLDYPYRGRVRIRRLYPKGSLLRVSTAGVYWPFIFEGHIDPGLHPITWPFTMTHEMGHGYGFADEGTCNFLSWLSCTRHADIFIQYSGWMGYFRYLLSDFRRAYPRDYGLLFDKLSPEIQKDLRDIAAYSNRYDDIFPEVRDVVYDSYLKSHGVQGGLINYSYIIKMAEGWKILEATRGMRPAK